MVNGFDIELPLIWNRILMFRVYFSYSRWFYIVDLFRETGRTPRTFVSLLSCRGLLCYPHVSYYIYQFISPWLFLTRAANYSPLGITTSAYSLRTGQLHTSGTVKAVWIPSLIFSPFQIYLSAIPHIESKIYICYIDIPSWSSEWKCCQCFQH